MTRKFKLHPDLTVYTAEHIAIQKALQWILENNLDFKTSILTDSLSAIQSIQSGKSKTRQDILDHVLYRIHCIIKRGLILDIDWVPSHCNIQENELADAAAKSALNTGKSINLLPSHQEIYPITRAGVCKTLCPQLPGSNTASLQHCLRMTVTTIQIYEISMLFYQREITLK